MTDMIRGRRDPNSNAVVSTDTGAWAKARARKMRAKEIQRNEQELETLRDQVSRLTEAVEQLLRERNG